ncbi:MAG: hypothetical protein ACRBBN_16735 [Methyloligellaceae bacterium]
MFALIDLLFIWRVTIIDFSGFIFLELGNLGVKTIQINIQPFLSAPVNNLLDRRWMWFLPFTPFNFLKRILPNPAGKRKVLLRKICESPEI